LAFLDQSAWFWLTQTLSPSLVNAKAIDHDKRKAVIDAGIRFGESGQAFTEKVGRMPASLVESVVAQPGLAKTGQQEIEDQASQVKAEILAEFFLQRTHWDFSISRGNSRRPRSPQLCQCQARAQQVARASLAYWLTSAVWIES